MDIPLILHELFLANDPKPDWGWKGAYVVGKGGEDYNNLDWRDDVIPKPTLQAITDAWPAVEKKHFTDVVQAETDKKTLISALRAGTVSAEVLQEIVADILEGK